MHKLIKKIWLRTKLILALINGREVTSYAALVSGHPVAHRLFIFGRLECGDNAVIHNCTIKADDGKGNGIVVGDNSLVIGCVATGWDGYGFNTAGQRGALMHNCPSLASPFLDLGEGTR